MGQLCGMVGQGCQGITAQDCDDRCIQVIANTEHDRAIWQPDDAGGRAHLPLAKTYTNLHTANLMFGSCFDERCVEYHDLHALHRRNFRPSWP